MKLVLRYHTPEEWAAIRYEQAINLGCSEEYARQLADDVLVRTAL